MRLFLLSLFVAAASLYGLLAFRSYRQERLARDPSVPATTSPAAHPEANLRSLREAMERDDYSNDLLPRLESAFDEAPSFYQPPLLLAAFYANRLERPDLIRRSFELAVSRFPSNGRLRLSYAEWLLTPRATAPYRAYRDDAPEERTAVRKRAIEEIEAATGLEPDLTATALEILTRFQTPIAEWADRLPGTDGSRVLILGAIDRLPRDRDTRRRTLSEFLEEGSSPELFRMLETYAERWDEPEIALASARKWRQAALDQGLGSELARATVALARNELDRNEGDEAYRLLRATLAVMEERSLPEENALDLLCQMGELYLRRNHAGTAQGLFSEAVARSRDYVPAYLGLARMYQTSGDLASARSELEQALALDPSNDAAVRQLHALDEIESRGNTRR